MLPEQKWPTLVSHLGFTRAETTVVSLLVILIVATVVLLVTAAMRRKRDFYYFLDISVLLGILTFLIIFAGVSVFLFSMGLFY